MGRTSWGQAANTLFFVYSSFKSSASLCTDGAGICECETVTTQQALSLVAPKENC
jgi:hypothetical protein